jgi:serine phosphatase RsbU (regulator of sigma subunit)
MFRTLPPSPQTGIDTLAEAWLGAGATAVSIWKRQQLIRQWTPELPVDRPDFVTPVRIGTNRYAEMHISGFQMPGWSRLPNAGDTLETVRQLLPSSTSQGWSQPAPAPQTSLPELDVFVASRPALQVGGDYYDLIHESSGRVAFSVADVAGKGLAAAMYLPKLHRALRECLHSTAYATPDELMGEFNRSVYPLFADTARFATALLGCYDADNRSVTFANAGHSPVIYRPAQGEAQLLRADNIPLGILHRMAPIAHTITLGPGDMLLVATDGIAEARGRNGQMFGFPRLLDLVNALAHERAQRVVDKLFQQVSAFGSSNQDDDQTIMVLKGSA